MRSLFLDKDILSILSGWFSNLSAGWFASIFILPVFTDANHFILLTVNLFDAILALVLSILLIKRTKKI